MVPPDSHWLPLIPWYLGTHTEELKCFRLRDFHPLSFAVPCDSANKLVFDSSSWVQIRLYVPHNTSDTRLARFNVSEGLDCSAFARHYWRNRWFTFSSYGYWDISLPRVGSLAPMNSARSCETLLSLGCPIRKSPGHRLFPPIRRLSQVITSFVAFWCQGIHRMLLIT